MCHPKGRSAAKDARSALTRRPARSYSAPTIPATVRHARRRSGERHERSIPRPPALPAPLADPPIAPQPTHTRLRRADFRPELHAQGNTMKLIPHHPDDRHGRRDGAWRVVRIRRPGGNRHERPRWEVHERPEAHAAWHCHAAFERRSRRAASRRPAGSASDSRRRPATGNARRR